jgi:signal peptidase I
MVDRDKPTVVINDPDSDMRPSVVISNNLPSDNDEEPEEKPNVEKAVKGGVNFFFDFLETIVVALSIFVVVYLFLVQPHEVKGSSMEPNFHNNEYILTDKISFRFQLPKRGDVVIFKAPTNPDVDYIKRVIALPGERVKVEGGSVYVNDQKLNEPYLRDATTLFPGSRLQEGVDITIDQDNYFVLGDNRPHSSDSREFGPIPRKLIVGKAFFRYWPVTEFGLLPHISY